MLHDRQLRADRTILPIRAVGCGMSLLGEVTTVNRRSDARVVGAVTLISGALNAASHDFFGSERRTNATRWTPGPAIPAITPKQGANRDDHSNQRDLNRPRHDQ